MPDWLSFLSWIQDITTQSDMFLMNGQLWMRVLGLGRCEHLHLFLTEAAFFILQTTEDWNKSLWKNYKRTE